MNNPKLNVPTQGRRASDLENGPGKSAPDKRVGDTIFHLVAEAEGSGKALTVWDLRKLLDLPLHEIFVSLRSLEFEGLMSRGTPSQDPLTAPLMLTSKGYENYFG